MCIRHRFMAVQTGGDSPTNTTTPAKNQQAAGHLWQESSHNHNRLRNDFVLSLRLEKTEDKTSFWNEYRAGRRTTSIVCSHCFRCCARRFASSNRLVVL